MMLNPSQLNTFFWFMTCFEQVLKVVAALSDHCASAISSSLSLSAVWLPHISPRHFVANAFGHRTEFRSRLNHSLNLAAFSICSLRLNDVFASSLRLAFVQNK
jgi:hypothetical protein